MSLAIVTGGSRGIGAAIAEKLAQDGFDVLINCASSVEKAEAVAEKCRAHGVNAYVKKWDVADYDACSTALNEKYETIAIKKAFGDEAYNVKVSSTKSMTGHLLGGAAAVEAIACVMAIREGIVPPTIGYKEPDPECDLDITPNKAVEMPINVAISNSLGFGGHNACILIKKV